MAKRKRKVVVPEEISDAIYQAKKDFLISAVLKCAEQSKLELSEQIYCIKLAACKLENDYMNEIGLDLNFKFDDLDENQNIWDVKFDDFLNKD